MSHNIKARLFTEDKAQVCHMHTDPSCNHTAIGTRRTITLWDLEQGCRVEGSEVIHCYSNMLVYVEPNAFVLNGNDGVEVWNLKTGEHVKHVNIDMRFYSIGTNGDQIIMSTGYTRYLRNTVNFSNSCVVIFSTSELADLRFPPRRCAGGSSSGTSRSAWSESTPPSTALVLLPSTQKLYNKQLNVVIFGGDIILQSALGC